MNQRIPIPNQMGFVFMQLPKIIRAILCAAILVQSPTIFAFETDQYNLPMVPLADIGDEVSEYVEQNVRKAVEKVNREIAENQACLDRPAKESKCKSDKKVKKRLEYLRSEEAIVREIFKPMGGGIPPTTRSGSWMEKHKFKGQPARYKTSYSDSIYTIIPTSYITISPTVNLYGVEFGTDKIAHIFQQGYTYYKIYEKAILKGATPEKAALKAIKYGKRTEATYYGYFVSGVYSNGDLASNFIGMKFYQGLLHDTEIGDMPHRAILSLKDGIWKINDEANLRENLLKPYISDHLNEAHNPSVYFKLFWLDSYVRKTVRKQSCPQWHARFPEKTKSDYAELTETLKDWHGEDYGHKESSHFISIANTCFSETVK